MYVQVMLSTNLKPQIFIHFDKCSYLCTYVLMYITLHTCIYIITYIFSSTPVVLEHLQEEMKKMKLGPKGQLSQMKQKAEDLKSARESERQEIAQEKLYQHWRENNPQIKQVNAHIMCPNVIVRRVLSGVKFLGGGPTHLFICMYVYTHMRGAARRGMAQA